MKDIKIVLRLLEMVLVALENIDEKVATLKDDGNTIVAALTRAWE